MRSLLILSSLLLVFVNAQLPPSPISPYITHESRTRLPAGWSRVRKHEPSAVIPLRFGLTQSNIHNIEDLLMGVSHPDSPNYGDHWTPSKVAQTFAPSDETVDTVREWLTGSGLASERVKVTSSKSWMQVNVTVEEAERLLHTEYHVYQHKSGSEHIACDAYQVPSHVAPHVDLITPTIHFDAILAKRGAPPPRHGVRPRGLSSKTTGHINVAGSGVTDCDKQTTPDCLRALYGVPDSYKPSVPEKNRYGIVEYGSFAYLPSDLEMFAKTYAPDLVGKSPELVSIDGGVIDTSDETFYYNNEPDLDLQYGMSLVTAEQPVTLYQVGDLVESGSFNNFLDALDGSYCTSDGGDDPDVDSIYPNTAPGGYKSRDCGTAKPENVITTTYAYDEANLSHFYMARQCAEYAKLGLMGVTILFPSGDDGVASYGGDCLNSSGKEDHDKGTIFSPSFPSTCPFVTSVGVTQVKQGGKVTDPETAVEVIQSGGGFSNHFSVPDYQRAAVSGYLEAFPPKGFGTDVWNSTGTSRAIPDISANGANYVVAVNGKFHTISSSSASTITVGAILTMVNDARIAKGKKPIGFINPAIYSGSFKSAFNDITDGSNPGCGTGGFAATEGWDAVTGLGTPKFEELVSAWMSLT